MNPRQLSLVAVLGLISSTSAFAADLSDQGGGWHASSASADEAASSTLSGKLYRNSADQNGSAPFIVLDRWGVVRGYVSGAPGVELESCVGRQVSLQGATKTLPGGDMPFMTCQRVLSGNAEARQASAQAAIPSPRELLATAPQDDPSQDIAPQPESSTRRDQAADDSRIPVAPAPERTASHRRRRDSGVQSTAYQEALPEPVPVPAGHFPRPPVSGPMIDPSPMDDGSMVSEGPTGGCGCNTGGRPGCATCGAAPCNACGAAPCNSYDNPCCDHPCPDPCWGPRMPIYCWGPTGVWVKTDYLQWWERGTHVPALVTTGPDVSNPGIIGKPGTVVLFGDDYLNDKSVSGGRIAAGMWLNRCATVGFEGEFFALADENSNYSIWSDGNPIISRPFFDTDPNVNKEAIENVAFPRGYPNSVDGSINVSAISRFRGAGAHFLFTTCRLETCSGDACGCEPAYHDRFRADLVIGYRYLDLLDQLGITEDLTSTTPVAITAATTNLTGAEGVSAFLVRDQFNTQNTFNGGDFGMKFEFERNRWSLDLFPRIAVGSTHEVVDINGSTRTTSPAGMESTAAGGLLALPSNIGHYEQDSFSVVPELDMKVGFQLTCHTKVVLGYDILYWSAVARAGEQIDRNVNATYLPGSPQQSGSAQPLFAFQETGFWAQGINVGLDCRW